MTDVIVTVERDGDLVVAVASKGPLEVASQAPSLGAALRALADAVELHGEIEA